jgi:thioredoxin-like negative regulator of GroEL
MGKNSEAMEHFYNCLRINPVSENALLMAAIASNRNGDCGQAEKILNDMLIHSPGNKHALLWLIDCRLKSSDARSAAAYTQRLVQGVPADRIDDFIQQLLRDGYMTVESRKQIVQWILEQSKVENAS